MEKNETIRDGSSPVRSMESSVERILDDVLNSSKDSNGTSSSHLSIFGDNSIDDPNYVPDSDDIEDLELQINETVANSKLNQNVLLQPRNVMDTGTPSRKRIVNKPNWRSQQLSRKRQAGKEYINTKGKTVPAKCVKPPKCDKACPFNCTVSFLEPIRKEIHSDFWVLSDLEKRIFYTKYVTVAPAKRKRTTSETSRKQNSFHYSLKHGKEQLRVCRSFFLATLSISQRTVYYFFKNNFNPVTGVPKPSSKGKHKKKTVSIDHIQKIRSHIESFPCIDSHYLRADTQRQYLEPGLSIKKMYRLFKSENEADNIKYHYYRKIFNTEYNLSFFVPKKDLCDACCKYQSISDPSEKQTEEHLKHKELNQSAKERKKADKQLAQIDPTVAIISYDLQNVFNLPKGSASNFFYKRKLNLYNLTGYCHTNGITYCSIWYESQSGRTGNDIASALIKILKSVINDLPQVRNIILWSDSCVPQNRNRITSLALLKFCENNLVHTIVQRFSVPGHSRVQEVDAVHSVIERHLKHIEYHSPISLLRHLKAMDYENVKLKLMQMHATDFDNYNKAGLGPNFCSVKFTEAIELLFEKDNLFAVKYKKNYGNDKPYETIPLMVERSRVKVNKALPIVPKLASPGFISKEKAKDIQSMFSCMPYEDIEFYKVILKLPQSNNN